jgi:hypothetical protein
MDELELVGQATERYRETAAEHEQARQALIAAVLDALRAGKRPTDVTGRSPFKDAYVRRLARDNGIPAHVAEREHAPGDPDELELVSQAAQRYTQTGAEHEQARQASVAAVLAALRARRRPTDVAGRSPFEAAYVRRLARDNGIPEYLLDRYPHARGELDALLPAWPQAAARIGLLGAGLDDADYVGGVLWYGLTHRGGMGNPAEQRRVITGRLTRWATRDGGDGSAVAAAIGQALDGFMPPG